MKYDPSKRKRKRATKAYNNNTFLNSREARSLRVQCEIVEPAIRLKRSGVDHMISFFGSARLGRDTKEHTDYLATEELAYRLGVWTNMYAPNVAISSGGGPGIMEACNKGAHRAEAKSVGMGISLPGEQCNNDYISDELDFEFHYFFTRKYWCVYLSKAFVLMPGGVGTLDELFEVLTLIQTEKMKPVPIVLYNRAFWEQVVNFKHMVNYGTISIGDLHLFKICDTVDEAYDHIINGINLT